MTPPAAFEVPSRRRIYLMRHAAVTYFPSTGRPLPVTEVPLNELGRQQAAAAGEALSGIPIDRVVSSDLVRCTETARLALGGRPVPIESCAALREIAPGNFRELPAEDLQRIIAEAFGTTLTRESRFIAGETFGSLLDRVLGYLDGLLAEPDWQQLLVVAHGGVNRVVLTDALGSGLPGFGHLEQDPACLNIIDIDDRGRRLVRLVNYTPYNPLKEGPRSTTMERLYAEFLEMFAGR